MTNLNLPKISDVQGNGTKGENHQVQHQLLNGDPSLKLFLINNYFCVKSDFLGQRC